jgi:hypothetical protein
MSLVLDHCDIDIDMEATQFLMDNGKHYTRCENDDTDDEDTHYYNLEQSPPSSKKRKCY